MTVCQSMLIRPSQLLDARVNVAFKLRHRVTPEPCGRQGSNKARGECSVMKVVGDPLLGLPRFLAGDRLRPAAFTTGHLDVNYYKRHLGDYAKDTGHLTALEHGIYNLLLDWYYTNERPIPSEKAIRIAKGNREETESVLSEYFHLTDSGWVHHYADREIADYHRRAEINRATGKLGGRPRKNRKETESVSERKPNGNPQETLATSHKPLASNNYSSDRSTHPTPSAAAGVFEGHVEPVVTPNPVAAFAIAMTQAGFQVTAMNPDLAAYVDEGGTVTHLMDIASWDDCKGKKAGYVISIGRRELAERARSVSASARASPQVGKTMQGIQVLEEMKRGLASKRTDDGVSEAPVLRLGTTAGG